MVDGDGRIYNGDELLYAIVRERMSHGPVAGVVGTLMTNYGFELQMQRLGIGFGRAKVGDRYVMEQMQARGWLYGGESRSEEHTSELQSLMRISYAAFFLYTTHISYAVPLFSNK